MKRTYPKVNRTHRLTVIRYQTVKRFNPVTNKIDTVLFYFVGLNSGLSRIAKYRKVLQSVTISEYCKSIFWGVN